MFADKKIRVVSITLLLVLLCYVAHSQSMTAFADSIRKASHIPELAYAVVSSDKVLDIQILGEKKIHSNTKAELTDRFRIGSNTKAITGFIAARLVKEGKLSWDTKFFDLYPELKAKSRSAYYNYTLQDLLSFRAKLYKYTYTYPIPTKEQFHGTEEEQRYQFAAWFLQQKPVKNKDTINFSNLCYVAVGLMLEKATSKTYKQLVQQLGTDLGITFDFGQPNSKDSLQPEAPGDSYKLGWLLPAGNINVSLPDYIKFIQLQLQGLKGRSTMLNTQEFQFLHFGLAKFSIGWFWDVDDKYGPYSHNVGNPGTFLSIVYVYKNTDRAYILLSNVQSEEAEAGLNTLLNELIGTYDR